MNKLGTIIAVACLLVVGAAASASAQASFTVQPYVYNPDNACQVTSQWQNGVIVLAKNCTTATNASADVEIVSPLEGGDISALTELNFDVQNNTHCGAGAPRFNVVVAGTTYFLGCAGGTHTDLGNGYTHVVYGPADFAAAGIPATGTLEDLYIVFDEGTDTPVGGGVVTPGSTSIDNISINGETVGGAAQPMTKNDCKKGGWRSFSDPKFKNQGQCVAYVVAHKHGKGGH